jgi:hypothetical protein
MPVTTTEIKKYSVSVISDGEPNRFAAAVLLFDAAGKVIAFLRFYVAGVELPANELRADLGYPLVSYPASPLGSVVDVLRNEKPIYFTWHDYSPARCFGAVGTSREPIGDGEKA